MHHGKRRRVGPAPRTLVPALLTVMGLLLTACQGNEGPEKRESGSVVTARSEIDPVDGTTKVLLPIGKLVLRSGKPMTRLEAEQTRDHVPYSSPEGGTFVPVRWTFYTDLFSGVENMFGEPRTLSLSLVADGERYGLPAPRKDASGKTVSNMYVAVEGDPKSLELDVEYAGVTQTADLMTGKVRKRRAKLLGRAAEFKTGKTTECPSEDWPKVDDRTLANFGCEHSKPMVTPYLNGKFAKRGYAFVVMRISSNLTTVARGGDVPGSRAVYSITKNAEFTRLGGRKPIKTFESTDEAGLADGFLAWRVGLDDKGDPIVPKAVDFERRYKLELDEATEGMDPRERMRLTVKGKIPLRL